MKPANFQYERPDTIETALELLSDDESDVRILAGGQSLVPMMNFRVAKPDRLIDINRIAGLDHIRLEGDRIVIGALARHAEVKQSDIVAKHLPLVAAAYDYVAHSAVRNRGTLGGNLCHADPASEMPALMLALDATLIARSSSRERKIPAKDFFLGLFETALEPGEMLVEISIPIMAPTGAWGFSEVSMRKGDFAWVLAASLFDLENGLITNPAIVCAGVGDCAVRLEAVESFIAGEAPSNALFDRAGIVARDAINPPGDPMTDANYRRDGVQSLVAKTLNQAASRAA